jgi:hypothetical protein
MKHSVPSNTVKIEEGKSYPFTITGLVELPDGTEHFVLTDPNHVKHLLEKRHYLNYHFEPGQIIDCRIDKINCNGKIYIEPKHPYYRVGKSYDFPLIRISVKKTKKGTEEKWAVFLDVFENEIKLPLNCLSENVKTGENIRLFVERIKKGMIYLSDISFIEDYTFFKPGTEYPFILVDLIEYAGKRKYFVIQSELGLKFRLRYKYFEKYGFKIGQNVYCKLVRDAKNLYLEPRHPFYSIGIVYDFEIIGVEPIRDYPDGIRRMYVLNNDYGKNIFIPFEKIKSENIFGNTVKCEVREIKKSRLYLRCNQKKTSPV